MSSRVRGAPVFVAGEARHSVARTGDLINGQGRYVESVEPFNPIRHEACARFGYTLYLRPEDTDAACLDPARSILSRPGVLVLESRANLWLGWLRRQFPDVRLVWVIRHPCAVASSQLLIEGQSRLLMYLRRSILVHDFLAPYADAIGRADDPFEKHVYAWCIKQLVPLRQLSGSDVHVVFYEDLVRRTEEESARLSDLLGHPCGPLNKRDELLRVLDLWRAHVADGQRRRAAEILATFGLNGLYDGDIPNRNFVEAALGRVRTPG
jgi:hypothetical protein